MQSSLSAQANAAPHSSLHRLATAIATLFMVAILAGIILGARHLPPTQSDDPAAALFATG